MADERHILGPTNGELEELTQLKLQPDRRGHHQEDIIQETSDIIRSARMLVGLLATRYWEGIVSTVWEMELRMRVPSLLPTAYFLLVRSSFRTFVAWNGLIAVTGEYCGKQHVLCATWNLCSTTIIPTNGLAHVQLFSVSSNREWLNSYSIWLAYRPKRDLMVPWSGDFEDKLTELITCGFSMLIC